MCIAWNVQKTNAEIQVGIICSGGERRAVNAGMELPDAEL